MAGGSTTDYNGLFKQAYADKLVDLIPKESVITRTVDFVGSKGQLGDTYNQPVIVRSEQGFTYAAANAGSFSINNPSTMKTRNAVVPGYQLLENCGIAYEAVYKSDGVNSFMDATKMVMRDALESFHRRLEIGNLYGQAATGLGSTSGIANGTATTAVCTFNVGQWAAGIWSTMEGAQLDVWSSADVKLNATTPVEVTSIDIVAKTITVTSTSTSEISAIKTGGTNAYLRFYAATGASGVNEAIGLDKILRNTGDLFGINATDYNLWRSNVVSTVGALTFKSIQVAVSTAFSRGLDEDVEILVNPLSWEALSTEQVAYRMLDSSYSTREVVNGFDALVFHSQNGKISIIAHKYVKEGDAFIVPLAQCIRIGSTDVTFNIPGTDSGQIFIQSPTNAGFTFRVYSAQQLLLLKPATAVLMTGITHS